MRAPRTWVAIAGLMLVIGSAGATSAALPRDRVPPTRPTIDGDGQQKDLRPVFTFGAIDRRTPSGRIRFRCAFDETTMAACARIHRPSEDLSFGQHVLRVQAVDLTGNASRTAVRNFAIVGSWDAAADFQRAPSPANPGRDRYGNTAWFYLYSPNPEHDPPNYLLLPFIALLDPGTEV